MRESNIGSPHEGHRRWPIGGFIQGNVRGCGISLSLSTPPTTHRRFQREPPMQTRVIMKATSADINCPKGKSPTDRGAAIFVDWQRGRHFRVCALGHKRPKAYDGLMQCAKISLFNYLLGARAMSAVS